MSLAIALIGVTAWLVTFAALTSHGAHA